VGGEYSVVKYFYQTFFHLSLKRIHFVAVVLLDRIKKGIPKFIY